MRTIKFSGLLNLNDEDFGDGFCVTIRKKQRGVNPVAMYCDNKQSFHNKFFPETRICKKGVFLCLLEYAENLWIVTKMFRCDGSKVDEVYVGYAGRLVVRFHKKNKTGNTRLKKQIKNMTVHSILDRAYSALKFHGYSLTRLKFDELKTVITNGYEDWKFALSSIKGIYYIADIASGGGYVGAAYGGEGIWGRWNEYIQGTFKRSGGDKGLERRIKKRQGSLNDFEFSILEVFEMRTSEAEILKRESWWKDTLRTRKNHNNNGMNEN